MGAKRDKYLREVRNLFSWINCFVKLSSKEKQS